MPLSAAYEKKTLLLTRGWGYRLGTSSQPSSCPTHPAVLSPTRAAPSFASNLPSTHPSQEQVKKQGDVMQEMLVPPPAPKVEAKYTGFMLATEKRAYERMQQEQERQAQIQHILVTEGPEAAAAAAAGMPLPKPGAIYDRGCGWRPGAGVAVGGWACGGTGAAATNEEGPGCGLGAESQWHALQVWFGGRTPMSCPAALCDAGRRRSRPHRGAPHTPGVAVLQVRSGKGARNIALVAVHARVLPAARYFNG